MPGLFKPGVHSNLGQRFSGVRAARACDYRTNNEILTWTSDGISALGRLAFNSNLSSVATIAIFLNCDKFGLMEPAPPTDTLSNNIAAALFNGQETDHAGN